MYPKLCTSPLFSSKINNMDNTASEGSCKAILDAPDKTQYPCPTDLPMVQPEGLEKLWEGIEKELAKEIGVEELYGPLDLSKVKLSKFTLRHYLKKRKKKTDRGNKHYKTRRLKLRLENYRRHAYLTRVQSEYRETLWGRYIFRRKKARDAKVEFKLTWDIFYEMHVNLGLRPGTDTPWWKYLGSDKRFSLQMSRIDKRGAWEAENIEFKYMDKHLAFARDLAGGKVPVKSEKRDNWQNVAGHPPEPNENKDV